MSMQPKEMHALAERLERLRPDRMVGEKGTTFLYSEDITAMVDAMRIAAFPAAQQLVARIKRGSKYWGQTQPHQWFEVRVVEDGHYQLRGNNNNYRFSDVACGMRLASGAIVDFAKGRIEK